MYERFTDRARRVIVLAQEEARMLNHNYIGTEHILLGLIHEGEGIAAGSLGSLGISLEGVRSQVEEIIGRGEATPDQHIRFTPRAKKVQELSLREALQLGHNYIGTEHILLGLIREGEGVAAQVLVKLGAELTECRRQIIQILGSPPPRRSPNEQLRERAFGSPAPMKHDTPEKKAVADNNTILRIRVGSTLHGTALPGTEDQDEMGLCIEPPEYLIGLRGSFEQYEERSQKPGTRSGPGDLDYTCMSLRKWAGLAAEGNPDTALPLFASGQDLLNISWPGHDLRARRYMFLSRVAAKRYIGALEHRRDRLLGVRSGRTNRPELEVEHGYDTKYASYPVRWGIQGIELLTTGVITLPMPEAARTYLIEIRNGEHNLETVVDNIEGYLHQLKELADSSPLPEQADYPAINTWLSETYQRWWDEHL